MTRALMLGGFGLLVAMSITLLRADEPVTSIVQDEPSTGQRVFELRTYIANEGKTESMHKRFRDHTNDLFKKHGMEVIGYWVPQEEKDGKSNTMHYLLAYPSREAAKKSWESFSNDPEWKRAKEESEKDGVLVNRAISVYLDPTDYSPLK